MEVWIFVLVCVFLVSRSGFGQQRRPPLEGACYSRFDYEYKVIQKLVHLEEGQTKLLQTIQAQRLLIQNLTEQLEGTSFKLSDLENRLLYDGIDRGSTYVRWGRTDCPGNGTQLVYSGYAGGSRQTHTGGAANYVCLPRDPIWGKYDDAAQFGGLMYGAEYEVDRNIFAQKYLFNNDVPCAVCRSPRPSVLMIPGRNQCYGNWTHEYHGYLMSGNCCRGHVAATEYVCMDELPESLDSGTADSDGKLFYFVEGRCGSLPCPPYVHGRELTCVVCSM